MKEVYKARDSTEAQFIRGELEARGIRAVVQGEALRAGVGDIPFFLAMPTVHVNDEDAERARGVIQELRAPTEERGEPWRCERCGELIEAQFSECWRCAAEGA